MKSHTLALTIIAVCVFLLVETSWGRAVGGPWSAAALGLQAVPFQSASQRRLLKSDLPGADRQDVDAVSKVARRLQGKAKASKKGNKKTERKSVLVDLTASDLQGDWVGTASPGVAFDGFAPPVCPKDSASCTADARLRVTFKISGGGMDFRYTSAQDEPGSCPMPILEETLQATVVSFENSQLAVSYTEDQFVINNPTFTSKSDEELGSNPTRLKQTACIDMKVKATKKKVRADVKLTKMFSGSAQGLLKHLLKPTTGFSVCTDKTLDCKIDAQNAADAFLQDQLLVDMECVSGKCLELADR